MKRTIIASGLLAAFVIGSTSTAIVAGEPAGVRGGGDVLVPGTGVYGSVSVHVDFRDDGINGNVNVDLYHPETGQRVQHFKGAVSDATIGADGLAYLCGQVTLLQLGTNKNGGTYFELVVDDAGRRSSDPDRLGWYRQGSPTDCRDGHPNADQVLLEGNLKVRQ